MSDLDSIVAIGERLGYSDDALRKFVKEEQQRVEVAERERRHHERDIKKLELEIAEKNSIAPSPLNQSVNNSHFFSHKGPKLPCFDETKDNMDAYLERFERYSAVQEWNGSDKAVFLSTLLRGKSLDVYSRLSAEESKSYTAIKDALMRAYQLTEEGFKNKFFSSKPEPDESPAQVVARMESYFDRWVDLAGIEKNYKNLRQLMLKEQFISNVHKDLAIFIREHKPAMMSDVAKSADTFLDARGWHRLAPTDGKSKGQGKPKIKEEGGPRRSGAQADKRNIRCFNCQKLGHKSFECRSPVNQSNNNNSRNSSFNKTSSSCVAVDDDHECSFDNSEAHLKCGCTIPMVTSSCVNNNILHSLPIREGLVEGKRIMVMRDTGCNSVVIRKSLISENALTGTQQRFIMIDNTIRSAPVAVVNIVSPYFSGQIKALCIDNPICDVVIGNIDGATMGESNGACPTQEVKETPVILTNLEGVSDCYSNELGNVLTDHDNSDLSVNAVVTRSKVGIQNKFESLNVPKSIIDSVSVSELQKLQSDDHSLRNCKRKCINRFEDNTPNGFERYYMHNNLMYRKFSQADEKVVKQLIVPKKLRDRIMSLGHESIMAGHMGIAKTVQRIRQNFYWPGIGASVRRFCLSCDKCQKTLPKGRVTKAPVQKVPLIDTPFRRVAIDIVGPIEPRSAKGNRFILTLVDYASRYPEAVALPSVETERVAEALLSIFAHVGIPMEILSDNGSQFTSNMMKEVCKLMSIDQLFISPYHAMANGLCEKLNGTLKQMLRRVCLDHPKDWDRYIEPVLFAYREVTQDSTGFSPFELVYGRTIRGPMAVLQQLWTKEHLDEEVKSTYEYVLELRNRLEETSKVALQNLSVAQCKYKKYFDRKAKPRSVNPGAKVLVLLPTKSNKLLLTWKGPYEVLSKVGINDYRIKMNSKEKLFHINMLKEYIERDNVCHVNMIAAIDDHSDSDFCNDDLLEDYPCKDTETFKDVHVNPELPESRREELWSLLSEFQDIFSNKPGQTDLVEHDVQLTDEKPICLKPYPIPHSLLETAKAEIQEMVDLDIIEPAVSPYRFPLILVKKKDGTVRPVIDFRRLNRITVFDAEPMCNAEQIYASVKDCQFFTKLDFCKGYWQIKLSERSKNYSAFYSPLGLYRFKVMLFGMINSGSSFNRMMRMLLKDLDQVDNFVDDVLCYSANWENHIGALRRLFVRVRDAHLTVKPSKCYLGFSKVEYVGHQLGSSGLTTLVDKVDKVRNAVRPFTKTELRAYLGLTGFYHRYIPNYAEIAAPLTDLLKRGTPNKLVWEDVHDVAFQTLKSRLCNAPILAIPDFDKQFVVRVDASDAAIGAVLLQESEDAMLHPIVYASRKLQPAEKSYSVIEKECLAIIWAINKFMVYIYGKPFLLQTDHQPLAFLNKAKIDNPRIMRWALLLQTLNFTIEVLEGKDNIGADYLSRADCNSSV